MKARLHVVLLAGGHSQLPMIVHFLIFVLKLTFLQVNLNIARCKNSKPALKSGQWMDEGVVLKVCSSEEKKAVMHD